MRSIEFTEDDTDDSEAEYNAMEAKIHDITVKYGLTSEQVNFAWEAMEDCKPYLRQNRTPLTKDIMFRGIHSSMPFLTKKVRLDDRRPLDLVNAVHELLNTAMTKKFGEPFRNALFVTGSGSETSNYGERYIVLPRGDFTFLWSPDVSDIYNHYDNRLQTQSNEDFVKELFSENKYSTSQLLNAISSHSEIMIRCGSYYALRVGNTNSWQRKGMELILHL